jgi:CubicO group peptidase (beta-lactamase class C family)
MIVDANQVLENEAVGFADIAARRPMTQDALFWIASTGKAFAGTAVMMLVEEGRISLDEPVATSLPGFNPPVALTPEDPANTGTRPAARPITVRMLLNHSSGMYGGSPGDSPTLDARPLPERVASYATLLQFDPGTRFWYGNADINTAGRIVEIVSGMPYEQFLATRLFEPLGMTETGLCPTEEQLKRLPTAYNLPDGAPALEPLQQIPFLSYPLSDCANRYAVPAGGMFSTAHDLGRFARMLLNGGQLDGRRYLSSASVDEMTRNQLSEEVRQTVPLAAPPDRMGYGLGWAVSLDGSYFHPGTGMTDIRVDPTHTIATILLMQSTTPASFEARAALLDASDARYAPR